MKNRKLTITDLIRIVSDYTRQPPEVVEDILYSALKLMKYWPLIFSGSVVIRHFGKFYPRKRKLSKSSFVKSGVQATVRIGYAVNKGLEVGKWKSTASLLNELNSALPADLELTIMDQLIFAQIVGHVISNPPMRQISGQALVRLCLGWIQAIAASPLIKRKNVKFIDNCISYDFRFRSLDWTAFVALSDLSEEDIRLLLFPEDRAILFTPSGWVTSRQVREAKGSLLELLHGLGSNLLEQTTSLTEAYLEVRRV